MEDRNKRVLGMTGGVGAGKSTVLSYMQKKYGAYIIQADLVAHELQQPEKACYKEIVASFGRGILNEDATINRERLGKLVYAKPEKLSILNHLVHPAVKQEICLRIKKACEETNAPFVVIEAALLLEDHYDQICDEIWYVYASEAVRTKRLMDSRNYSPEKIRSIMKNQQSEEIFRGKCKFVIDNSGNNVENTYEQIDKGLVEHGFL